METQTREVTNYQFPKYWNYGQYSSNNYGAHSLAFEDSEGNTFWFSYETLIAFRKAGHSRVIHSNDWAMTTGKHLNWIDEDHSKRVNDEEFNRLFKEQFNKNLK
ncbi:MAG: hypothetical protein WC222_11450 [Parachlamydiales bacterium]|jgi:hypothetical protein